MNCQKISEFLELLKVNSRGYIRNKNKVIDKIHQSHLKKIDSELTDIRVYIAGVPTYGTTKEVLEMIDKFIYNKQIK